MAHDVNPHLGKGSHQRLRVGAGSRPRRRGSGDREWDRKLLVSGSICRSRPAARSPSASLLPEDSTAVMDPDFGNDVEAALESHREPPPFSNDPRPEDHFPVCNLPLFRYRLHPDEFNFSYLPAGI